MVLNGKRRQEYILRSKMLLRLLLLSILGVGRGREERVICWPQRQNEGTVDHGGTKGRKISIADLYQGRGTVTRGSEQRASQAECVQAQAVLPVVQREPCSC